MHYIHEIPATIRSRFFVSPFCYLGTEYNIQTRNVPVVSYGCETRSVGLKEAKNGRVGQSMLWTPRPVLFEESNPAGEKRYTEILLGNMKERDKLETEV
jgi:hypothetical protein